MWKLNSGDSIHILEWQFSTRRTSGSTTSWKALLWIDSCLRSFLLTMKLLYSFIGLIANVAEKWQFIILFHRNIHYFVKLKGIENIFSSVSIVNWNFKHCCTYNWNQANNFICDRKMSSQLIDMYLTVTKY